MNAFRTENDGEASARALHTNLAKTTSVMDEVTHDAGGRWGAPLDVAGDELDQVGFSSRQPSASSPTWSGTITWADPTHRSTRRCHRSIRATWRNCNRCGSTRPAITDSATDSIRLVVDGLMYLLGPHNAVTAVDAATGKLVWEHDLGDAKLSITHRGVAYWESKDRGDRRILFSSGDQLQALEAKNR